MTRQKVSRLSPTEETYIETIDSLIEKHGFAVVTDIADKINVKSPSVTSMLQKLDSIGFVKYTRYRSVTLTKKGKSLAGFLKKRHKSLKAFLKLIGVDEEIAEKDSCGIEHIIHPMTMEKLTKFVEFVENAPKSPKWLAHFKQYEEAGKYPESCKDNKSAS
jgi:DtxR family Mn-dependent transcriptional regulator